MDLTHVTIQIYDFLIMHLKRKESSFLNSIAETTGKHRFLFARDGENNFLVGIISPFDSMQAVQR